MKGIYIFLLGASYGILMRIVFGLAAAANGDKHQELASGVMLGAFVFFVPFFIGFFTVYHQNKQAPIRLANALFTPWIPTLLFVLGTGLIMIEGSICIVMALPLFMLAATIGGLSTWLLLKWIKPKTTIANSLLVLPLLIGLGEMQISLPQTVYEIKNSTLIQAKPAVVWKQINHITGITSDELGSSFTYAIGVPHPLEGITKTTAEGKKVRYSRWQKDVAFEEPITHWEENRFIQWNYRFQADSFPAGALDEHVKLGGKYFDLIDTSYQLTPESSGTRLSVTAHYRVSTHFNWYASQMGKLLMQSAAESILALYKNRSEQVANTTKN